VSAGSLRARQLTPDEVILVVSRHASGVPIALIADQFDVPNEVVKAAIDKAKAARAARNGTTLPVAAPAPVPAAVMPEPAAAAPVVDEPKKRIDPADLYSYEELAEWGDDASINRARMLAERVRGAAEELRAMVRRRGEIDAQRAKIAEAERVLLEARNALAEITGGRGGNTMPGETAAIREWAIQHGHELSARGRIPADIVAAYRAAH
jgi:hypothetical protein